MSFIYSLIFSDFFTQKDNYYLWLHKCCRAPNKALPQDEENPAFPQDEETPAFQQDEGKPHKCSVCGKGIHLNSYNITL